jgi:hypothetical protein
LGRSVSVSDGTIPFNRVLCGAASLLIERVKLISVALAVPPTSPMPLSYSPIADLLRARIHPPANFFQ